MQLMVCVEDFQTFANEIYDVIIDCGFTKPLSRLVISDKVDVVQSIAFYHVILKTLGELSQFREGLETLKIARSMEQYGELLQEFFVISESEVTAGRKHRNFLFHIKMALYMFQNAYMMFLECLDECEKGMLGRFYNKHCIC